VVRTCIDVKHSLCGLEGRWILRRPLLDYTLNALEVSVTSLSQEVIKIVKSKAAYELQNEIPKNKNTIKTISNIRIHLRVPFTLLYLCIAEEDSLHNPVDEDDDDGMQMRILSWAQEMLRRLAESAPARMSSPRMTSGTIGLPPAFATEMKSARV